jgi:para-aminobenzoate synthetase component I
MRIEQLPYIEDSSQLFDKFVNDPWAVFLDSGQPYCDQGRYDFISSNPYATLVTCDGITKIQKKDVIETSSEDPLALIKNLLDCRNATPEGIPFAGGMIGYFSYDFGRSLEKLPRLAKNEEKIPEIALGIYDWTVTTDHQEKKTWLIGQGNDPSTFTAWVELKNRILSPKPPIEFEGFELKTELKSNMSEEDYAKAFYKVKDYLRDGDCYQVNIAQRFSAETLGSPWDFYKNLRVNHPAAFGAYIKCPYSTILSSSPESFLRTKSGKVETRPIKGTRPRSFNNKMDKKLAKELLGCEKDRAENLMIVDLMRNDLGRTCVLGTIKVDELFKVESFPTVHHLVSTVTGELQPDSHPVELIKTCFPPGSITGAPKIRAMEIIEELEPNTRGAAYGSVGYIGFNGEMNFNVSIRTLVHSDNNIRFWVGGGIVADSILEEEYQETLNKGAGILKSLKALSKTVDESELTGVSR